MEVFYSDSNQQCIPWESYVSIEKEHMARILKGLDLDYRIIITENTSSLFDYGMDTVVILKSDEFCRNVLYSNRVKAAFRNYYSKKFNFHKNIFSIPLSYLGYHHEPNEVKMLKRDIDIFFAGQIKYDSRKYFYNELVKLKETRSDLNIFTHASEVFMTGLPQSDYYRIMSNS